MKNNFKYRFILNLCLIVGLLLLLGAAVLSIAYGFSVGNVIALVLAGFFIALYFIYPKLSPFWRKLTNIKLLIAALFVAGMFVFIGINGAKNTVTFNEDCVLVLGCGIRGETILPTLQLRLDKCLEYLQKNPSAMVIVSGGQGRNEAISEAEAMKRYLVSQGVNAAQIVEENRSRNTQQNFQNSKILIDSILNSDYSVACITSNYHAYRTEKLSSAAGLPVTQYHSGSLWYLYPSAYFREMLSICKMWVSGEHSTQNKLQAIQNELQPTDCYYLVEKFVDSTEIGKKGHNKVEIMQYVNDFTSDCFIRIFFRRKENFNDVRKTDWWFCNNFIFDGTQGFMYFDISSRPEISDFNNDGYNDFTYRSIDAPRGGNDIRKLFIYDLEKDKFIYIKNSEEYPNLKYNKELDCITSYILTATQSQYFLKLDGDSLVPFAYIDTQMEFYGEDEIYIYVYEIDKNGNEILLERKKADFEMMPYFTNYKPLKAKK